MMNDYKVGEIVWANNKRAVVKETFASIFGKEYLLEYDDKTTARVQPWFVISYADALEKGYAKTDEEAARLAQEKAAKDAARKLALGDFMEGEYQAVEFGLGGFRAPISDINNMEAFKSLDPILMMGLAITAQGCFLFEEGQWAQKPLSGGYGLMRDYELKDGSFILTDNQSKTGFSDIKLTFKGGYILQDIELPDLGKVTFYYAKKK